MCQSLVTPSLSLRLLSLHLLGFSTSGQVTSLYGYCSQTHLDVLSLCATSSYCKDVGVTLLCLHESVSGPLPTPTLTTIILFGLLCLVPGCSSARTPSSPNLGSSTPPYPRSLRRSPMWLLFFILLGLPVPHPKSSLHQDCPLHPTQALTLGNCSVWTPPYSI